MAKEYKINKEQLVQINVAATRESQRTQGFFDGRFVQRSEPSKKIYKRQRKHKGQEDWKKGT